MESSSKTFHSINGLKASLILVKTLRLSLTDDEKCVQKSPPAIITLLRNLFLRKPFGFYISKTPTNRSVRRLRSAKRRQTCARRPTNFPFPFHSPPDVLRDNGDRESKVARVSPTLYFITTNIRTRSVCQVKPQELSRPSCSRILHVHNYRRTVLRGCAKRSMEICGYFPL